MSMTILDQVLTDLEAESAQLDGWVSVLDAAGWATVTPPEGWTVTHQIGHLHWTDLASHTAITDEAAFAHSPQECRSEPDMTRPRPQAAVLSCRPSRARTSARRRRR